jgi:hypothetical protein
MSDGPAGNETNTFKTSRRGLVAAAAILAAMVTVQKAHAFARPPRRRHPGNDKGGHSCFLRGTHILTPRGEIKVEDLAVGDLVSTFEGKTAPITWIGRRSHPSTQAERWPGELLPIKVSASALGPMVPHKDLYISAMHSIFVDGLLIPARNLVNGRTIAHCESIDAETIDYFHIELANHDVIFSEGAPTETLLSSESEKIASFDASPEGLPVQRPVQRPYAPQVPANRSAVLKSRLRSAASPFIDIRQPGDAVWERLAEHAEFVAAA